MALKPLNSVGGFSVGEIPANVILANADITANKGTFTGNLLISNSNASYGILTDNLYYSNGQPWDLQQAAGSNTEIQFNNNNDFGASANFTFNTATNLLTVNGNIQVNNANLGNLISANFVNVASNVTTSNLTVNLELAGNTANFSGNIVSLNANLGNLATANYVNVAQQINGNVGNFSGNVTALNANLGNLASANYVNVSQEINGNVANFTGNLTAANGNFGNLATANYVNVSQNLNVNVNANIGGNLAATYANFVGNVHINPNGAANFGILTDHLYYANGVPWDLQEAAGSNNEIQFNSNDDFAASANFTFDPTTNVLTVNGNANVTNTLLTPNVNSGTGNLTLTSNGFNTVYDNTGNVTFPAGGVVTVGTLVGNVQANINITAPNTTLLFSDSGLVDGSNAFTFNKLANSVTLTGNIQVDNANLGNLAYANYINVASNLVSNNVTVNLELAGNTANFSGNVILPNLTVNLALGGNTANFSGNVILPNLTVNTELSGNTANFSGNVILPNLTVNSALGGNTANFSGNVVSNNLTVNSEFGGNTANFSGNVILPNLTVNLELAGNTANFSGAVDISGNLDVDVINTGTLANGTSNIRIFQDANVTISSNSAANVVTITDVSLVVAGNIESSTGYVLANGNVTANGYLVGGNAVVTGEANVGSVLTSNITSTGNLSIYAGGSNENINLVPTGTGAVDVSGKKIIQLADPTNPNDAATKEYVDAMAGEGLDIHTPVRLESPTALNGTYAQGGTTQTTTDISGGKTITFSANHGLSVNDGIVWTNSFNGIVGGEAYWVQSTPALNQITIRDGYYGVEVTTLTNGTGLSQASRANPGVGATLTNAGANAALSIDGIATANNDRILVYTQSNAYENGVYVVSDTGNSTAAWVLTRATDFDKYLPDSPNGLSKGSYVFVTSGLTGAGESYVMTLPIGEVIIGTDNITFTQFSAAGSYTAGNGIAINGTTISANVDGVTTDIVAGNIVVKTSANLTTPNIGDATFSSLSWNTLSNGNVTANNLSIGNIANITLDLTVGGNIQANGTISSNANVSGLNLTTTGDVAAGANVVGANVTANSTVFAANANVTGTTITNILTVNTSIGGNTANFSGNVLVNNLTVNVELAGNTANFSGNVILPNLTVNSALAGNTANFSGNVILPNLSVNLELAGNTANFTGNLVAANLVTSGVANVANLNVTANVTSALNPNANLTLDLGSTTQRWRDVYAGNIDASGNLTIGGNLSSNNYTANIITANNYINVGNTVIRHGQVTTSSITANQAISTVPVSGITGVEWIIKGIDSAGSGKYSMAIITAVTDGTTVDYSTFGGVNLGSLTGSLAVNIVGSNIELQVTPSSSNSTVWVTQYRTI